MDLVVEARMLSEWENIFEAEIKRMTVTFDPAHDINHLKRVVKTAKQLAVNEKADLNIVVPAAWLHDFVVVPKDSPLRKEASRISAKRAVEFLKSLNYPEKYLAPIGHAIEAHSFSAAIPTEMIEAMVVQDADRLDALGAVGLARCFMIAGQLKTSLYSDEDPFCHKRAPDDQEFTIDHFYAKLFKLSDTLKTESAKIEGERRTEVMREYLRNLHAEI